MLTREIPDHPHNGEKRGELMDIYFDGKFVSTLTRSELEQMSANASAAA